MTSPMTNEPMEPLLVPNVMARRMVSDFLQARTDARKAELRAERQQQRQQWKGKGKTGQQQASGMGGL